MTKNFFPTVCPSCGTPLVIERGDSVDTLKLMCKNDECEGSLLKKLQKGIMALEIKGLGPAIIEDLMNAGITSSLDLFNPEKFNEDILISSGYFVKGRSLEKIIDAVKSTKSIPINKALLSLQLENIGKTFSEKIGLKLSNMESDFSSLQLDVRAQLDIENSPLNKEIKESIEMFENFGVEIVRYKPKVYDNTKIKKVSKYVSIEDNSEIKDIVDKLQWEIVDIEDDRCQMYIGNKSEKAEELNIKILSLQKLKILFC